MNSQKVELLEAVKQGRQHVHFKNISLNFSSKTVIVILHSSCVAVSYLSNYSGNPEHENLFCK